MVQKKTLKPTYIFIHEPQKDTWLASSYLIDYIESSKEPELTLLYKHDLIKIINTKQWCNGVHFQQIGRDALTALESIKEEDGFLIMNGENSSMMSDTIDIDHFHIGKAKNRMTSKIMGIPKESGFIQFVPAAVRTTLAYPTPIQTSKEFNNIIKSQLFKQLSKKIGEKELFKIIGEDAKTDGTPIDKLLKSLNDSNKVNEKERVLIRYLGGVYSDGYPWSGVLAKIDTAKYKWQFKAYIAEKAPKSVPNLLKEYAEKSGDDRKVNIAWNGGYILNPELVGKLGLSGSYIGSPLGLLILDGKLKSPPLFNKPALLIYIKEWKIRYYSCKY